MGGPGASPGRVLRMLVVGCLERIGSERGIVWRCPGLDLGAWLSPPVYPEARTSMNKHTAMSSGLLGQTRADGSPCNRSS